MRRKVSVVIATTVWFLGVTEASAHDWYPAWCCNDKDCRELAEEKGETVVEAPDGWHLWDGRLAARDFSQDVPRPEISPL